MHTSQNVIRSRETPPSCSPRIASIGLLILLTFSAFTLRLWYLQLEEGALFRVLSERNRLRLKWIPPMRGVIYDRVGRVVVDNRPSFDVVVVPEDAPDLQATLSALTAYLPGELTFTAETLPHDPRRPPYAGVVAARDVAWSTLVAVESHQLDIPGVSVEVSSKRTYPAGKSAAHLLGYVGEVSPSEMTHFPGYRHGDLVGKVGIEKAWEPDLRGQSGGQQIEVDALGRRLRVLKEVEASIGQSLMLTLDLALQQEVEAALGDQPGAIVVLAVQTGEVLAMTSHPAFDPNLFARGIKPAEWRALYTDPLYPLTNRAIQGQYPPGSTFKVILAAAALEKGVVTPTSRFFCPGGLQFGGRRFRCWKRGGHGSLTLRQAIAQSCDVYFYQVGQRLGIQAIAEYARRFGLGRPLGVALDHEASGLIPDADWKKRTLGAPWYAGETLSVAIGQGYVTATPLQMAVVTSTVANGGTVYRPYFVKRVAGTDGGTIRDYGPEVINTLDIDPQVLHVIREGMLDVVKSPRGTGKKAGLPDVQVAGKTGTSQVIAGQLGKGTTLPRRYRDHAWFIAYAPAETPEVAVACLLEHAGEGGGKVAAPVVQKVLKAYFALTREGREEKDDVRQEAHFSF